MQRQGKDGREVDSEVLDMKMLAGIVGGLMLLIAAIAILVSFPWLWWIILILAGAGLVSKACD